MNRLATVFFALGLATAGSTALAAQANDQVGKQASKPQPVKMTDAQMDNVAGGALLTVVAFDVIDVENVANNLRVAIPVNAAAAISILGTDTTAIATQPGNINQPRR